MALTLRRWYTAPSTMNGDTESSRKRFKRRTSDIHTFIHNLENILSPQYSSTQAVEDSHFYPSHLCTSTRIYADPTGEKNFHLSHNGENLSYYGTNDSNNSTMNVALNDEKRFAPSEPEPLMLLPPMELIAEGLESVDSETLRQSLDPILKSLESIDALAMLDLKRVEQGARVSDGVFVQPIHNQVMPIKERLGSCVRYIHVSEVPDKYSVGIFIFPPHARIPLHDHPGMCVLSRVLYGDLERISLDLVRNEKPESSWFSSWIRKNKLPKGSRRAYLKEREHLQAPQVTVLYPYEGNLHEFIAGPSGAAVLDVLLPPYDEYHDRECTYYSISFPEVGKGPCWIVPTGQPEDFHCLSGRFGDLGDEDDYDEEQVS